MSLSLWKKSYSYNLDVLVITIGLPQITVTLSAQSIEVTQSVVLTTVVTGVGPFNYQWQRGNDNITGQTGPTFTIYDVSESDQANYSCYVNNNYGDSVVSNIVTFQTTSM